MKTSELTGATLDWAVAKCEPDDTLAIYFDEDTGEPLEHDDWQDNQTYSPSTNWAQGGPIIEREKIDVMWCHDRWCAYAMTPDGSAQLQTEASTPLVAAMQAYVASVLGGEIDVPKELTDENV